VVRALRLADEIELAQRLLQQPALLGRLAAASIIAANRHKKIADLELEDVQREMRADLEQLVRLRPRLF
jgi:hypothetical protein